MAWCVDLPYCRWLQNCRHCSCCWHGLWRGHAVKKEAIHLAFSNRVHNVAVSCSLQNNLIFTWWMWFLVNVPSSRCNRKMCSLFPAHNFWFYSFFPCSEVKISHLVVAEGAGSGGAGRLAAGLERWAAAGGAPWAMAAGGAATHSLWSLVDRYVDHLALDTRGGTGGGLGWCRRGNAWTGAAGARAERTRAARAGGSGCPVLQTRNQDFPESHQHVLVLKNFFFLTHVNYFDDLLCCFISYLNLNFNLLNDWSSSCNHINKCKTFSRFYKI